MKLKIFASFDYLVFAAVLLLVTMGVVFIYSSGINSDGVLVTNEYVKQIVWATLGLVILIFASLYDYRKFEKISSALYFSLLIFLVITLIFGRRVNGARSWLGIGDFGIQVSEFGKIIFIIFFAKFLSESAHEEVRKRFAKSLLIFAPPVLLILAQPDLGTASVYIPIFLIMCFMANVPLRFIMFTLLFGFSTIFLGVLPVWNDALAKNKIAAIVALTHFRLRLFLILSAFLVFLIALIVRRYLHGKKYFYWIGYFSLLGTLSLIASYGVGKVLKDYQIKRLIIFLDPSIDPRGAGWNIIQSKIAIGAGGIFGRGLLHGTQSHYRFLPQQSTDFIFSILSEELGFLGAIFVFSLYSVLFFRMLKMMRRLSSFPLFIVSGIFGMFFFHFFINIGMVMGLMPITGIPLLFLSYGGSSLWTAMLCIGIIMSIYSHRYGEVFGIENV